MSCAARLVPSLFQDYSGTNCGLVHPVVSNDYVPRSEAQRFLTESSSSSTCEGPTTGKGSIRSSRPLGVEWRLFCGSSAPSRGMCSSASAMHSAAIVAHTMSGAACFLAASMLLQRRLDPSARRQWFVVYGAGLLGLVAFMGVAIVSHWPSLPIIRKIIFSGLLALGAYMSWRGWLAWRAWRGGGAAWRMAYINHVGFTLISLFDGFVIVSAIDIGAPGWSVALIAVLGVAVGVWVIARVKRTSIVEAAPW